MATSLATQLKAIAKPKQQFTKNNERASLLFEPKAAADIDNDHVYALAINGLAELKNLDSRFAVFEKNLFSEQSKENDREVMVTPIYPFYC